MKNKKQTILIILISVLIILGITAFVLTTTINKTKANTETGEEDINAQQTISFNDINLYNAIKEQLHSKNIEYTANDTNKTLTMTQENIDKVERFGLDEKNISDLTGLEKFRKLQVLYLQNNQISDISALSNLTNLQELYLYTNQISDISAVSGLTKLQTLDLHSNQISDISALSNLTKLQKLYLNYNQISDISALSNLTNLTTLSLGDNQISDISAVSGLTNLQTLYLCPNQNSDISALSGLTNLQMLILSCNQISDISALSGLTNLQWLYLENNQISDISALSGLTKLQTLYLNYNQISDISALSGLTNLQTLALLSNQISDISALSNLTNLTTLSLGDNQISDISALSGLTNLQKLKLNKNNIEDITPINNMSSLQECKVYKQTINKTITSGKEIALPQILIDAKKSSSKAYVGNGIDYQLTNCTISSDGKKVIVNDGETTAKVTIGGTTGAYGTVLEIDVTSPILTVTYDPPQKLAESVVVTIKSSKDIDTTKIGKSWTVVDSKTIQKTYIENVQEEITIYDLAGNSNKITIKITNICDHTGGYTIKYNETEHWEECTKCGAEKPGSRKNHIYGKILPNENGTHTKKCTGCSYSKTENCTYINGKCSECGATKPNTGCVHNYITKYNETEHWEYCTKCRAEKPGSRQSHTYGVATSNGNGTHTKKCTICSYSKTENCNYVNGKCSECGASKPDTGCTHNYEAKYNNTEHWEECTKCGAEKPGSRQNHTYGVATSNGNGTHSKKCTGCPYIRIEYCNYINGKCSECGTNKPDTECTHNYKIKYNNTEHWEECTKCGAEKPGSRQSHTYGVATSNGNGTHTKKCTVCSYSKTENCNYINGKCSECGANKPDTECTHNYKIKYNETEHWEECTKCGAEKPESRETHTYGVATSNGNGTHTKKCTVCLYSKTENCNYVNGKCSECGATKPDNENPGDGQDNTNNGTNNGQNNGNNTNTGNNNSNSNTGNSSGKPLPQTGTSSVVIIGIIAFTVLGTLTFIRIKKYKLN